MRVAGWLLMGTEFRVVGDEAAFGRSYVNDNPTSLEEAERMAAHFEDEGDLNVRIQQREVGPWENVDCALRGSC